MAQSGTHERKAGFRNDVNGLRAIAIAMVLGYHFKISGLGGGFAGVDVFFVISGFLMTGIILDRSQTGPLSLSAFYMARVRRIVPALVVLCLALLGYGLVMLDPLALENLSSEALTAVTFVSNIWLATKGGYFAAAPQAHWLLHSWSLSVEWQFYLLYPLLFILMRACRIPLRYTVLGVIAMTVLSLGLACWLVEYHTSPSLWYFYMLPNRAWEMLAGGLCAYACRAWQPSRMLSLVMHYAGLAAILACTLVLDESMLWPSLLTVPVVAATCLVLVASRTDAFWSQWLPVRLIGNWSYSIYLWHWPLLAALSTANIALTPLITVGLFAASVFAGFLSHALVERRLTNWIFASNNWQIKGLPIYALTLLAAAAAWKTHGFETQRTPDRARLAAMTEARAAMSDWAYPKACNGGRTTKVDGLDVCYVGNPKARDVLIIGDSHSQQIVPRYSALLAARPGQGATFVTQGGCMPIRGVSQASGYSGCGQKVAQAMKLALSGQYKRVVFVSLWSGYIRTPDNRRAGHDLCFENSDGTCTFETNAARYKARLSQVLQGFSADIRAIEQHGVKVTVTDVAPVGDEANISKTYTSAFFGGPLAPSPISRSAFDKATIYQRKLILDTALSAGADIVVPADTICSNDVCPTHAGGHSLYKDTAHIRASAIRTPRYGYLDPVIAPEAAMASRGSGSS